MLFTNHLLAGALVGRVVRRPLAAFLVGVASHAVMDAVPHWGKWDAEELLRIARVDGLVALGAAAATVRATDPPSRPAVLAGMIGAGLPDLDKPSLHFVGITPFPAWVDRLHARLQNEDRRRWWVEISAAAVLGLLVAAASRHRKP